MAPFFLQNKRDGARLISSGLLVFTVAATHFNQTWGQVLSGVSMFLCIYWGFAFCRLGR